MIELDIDRNKGDFHYDVKYKHDAGLGLTEETIDYIAGVKDEDQWITSFRNEPSRFLRRNRCLHTGQART